MEETTFDKFKDSLVRIAPNEFEATDPLTKGKWVVRANIPIGEMMALYAIATKRAQEDAAPDEGVTITIELEIRVEGN